MNLLIIDSNIPELDVFIQGINSNTSHVLYDVTKDTFEILTEKILNLKIDVFQCIGFVFVDEHTPTKLFVSGTPFFTFDNTGIIVENKTTQFIQTIVGTYNVHYLDFLACNLLSYPDWRDYFMYVTDNNPGLIVRASRDQTGNLHSGGNWILETTHEDIKTEYFNDTIDEWNYLLDVGNHTTLTTIDGRSWNCGNNSSGQLADTSIQTSVGFVQCRDVETNPVIDVNIVAASRNNTTAIVKTDGSVWACGNNSSGQLGDGTTVSSNFFVQSKLFDGINIVNVTNATAIACGNSFTAIVRSDGSVWACGDNTNGQLGNNTTSFSQVYIKSKLLNGTTIEDITGAVAIACGGRHTVMLRNDGSVWACGYNADGQLGNNTNIDANMFVRCIALEGVNFVNISNGLQVSCGENHTGIRRSNNTVWLSGLNTNGQLGDATNISKNRFVVTATDVIGTNITDATMISCGANYTLIARSSTGFAWGTGLNGDGQLGINNIISVNRFTQCLGPGNVPNKIATGTSHSVFIRIDQTISSCGNNTNNRCGYSGPGTVSYQNNPQINTGVALTRTNFNVVDVACGNAHSVIVRLQDGVRSLWAAGLNTSGQLSLLNRAISTSFLLPLTSAFQTPNNILMSVGGANYTSVIRTSNNIRTVWSAGINTNGNIGNGITLATSVLRQANNSEGVISIACGNLHTTIVKDDGTVWATGLNTNGQLGIDSSSIIQQTSYTQSILFDGSTTVPVTNAFAIACGSAHTAILRNDGSVWATGLNTNGQLGIQSTSQVTRFQKAKLLDDGILYDVSGAIGISCGTDHTVIVRNDGSVWATGLNSSGQLGINSIIQSDVFVKCSLFDGFNIVDVSSAVAVACGGSHTLILRENGTVWACGRNLEGQLGDGTNAQRNVFYQSIVENTRSILCGLSHSIIILNDGTIRVTGLNSSGQLGQGNTTNSNIFIVSPTAPTIRAKHNRIPQKNPLSSGFVAIQTNNAYAYFPNMLQLILVNTDVTNSSSLLSELNEFNLTNIKIIKLEPENTIFTDYIQFDINVIDVNAIKVFVKSELDASLVLIGTDDSNNYGTYYEPINDTNSVRIFTKHFSEVAVGNDITRNVTDFIAFDGDNAIRMVWSPPVNDGGAPLIEYEIDTYITSNNSFVSTTIVPHVIPEGNLSLSQTGIVINLINGTNYTFRIRARNSNGDYSMYAETSRTPTVITIDQVVVNFHSNNYSLQDYFTVGGGRMLEYLENVLNVRTSLKNNTTLTAGQKSDATASYINVLRNKYATDTIVIPSTDTASLNKLKSTLNVISSSFDTTKNLTIILPEFNQTFGGYPMATVSISRPDDINYIHFEIPDGHAIRLVTESMAYKTLLFSYTTSSFVLIDTFKSPGDAVGTIYSLDSYIRIGSFAIQLYGAGSMIVGETLGGGGIGDPYIRTICGKEYKLPIMDGAVRYYQGLVDGKQLTINVQLRKINNTELFDSNLHGWLEHKSKIHTNLHTQFYKSTFEEKELNFFEKVYMEYDGNSMLINIWDGKLRIESYVGKIQMTTSKKNHIMNECSTIYKDIQSTANLQFVFGSATFYVSLYDWPLVRNALYLHAPAMRNGNGVIVNMLSKYNMTLADIRNTAAVSTQDATRFEETEEYFCDDNGYRIKRIIIAC